MEAPPVSSARCSPPATANCVSSTSSEPMSLGWATTPPAALKDVGPVKPAAREK